VAVEKLVLATISGPINMVDTAIQRFVINRDFHPINAVEAMAKIKVLNPFESNNPYADMLQDACRLLEELQIPLDYRPFEAESIDTSSCLDYLSKTESALSGLREEREECLKQAEKYEAILHQLDHIKGVNERLSDLLNMKYLKFRYGRLPKNHYQECLAEIRPRDDVFYIDTGEDENWVYGIYFALPSTSVWIDAIFGSMGFQRVSLDREIQFAGTAEETAAQVQAVIYKARNRIAEIDRLIAELKSSEAENLLRHYSWLRYMNDAYEIRSYAGYRRKNFFIMGWLPAKNSEEFASECESIEGFTCILTEAHEVAEYEPPVKLRGNILQRIYTPFVEMFGVPSYGEIDPRMFMALAYSILFGIMFGDVGQGAVLAILGYVFWKTKKMWLGRVLICAGVCSVAMGFVYGSVFGYEDILPGFKVLEGENTMRMLLISVAIGVLLLLICMLMNIINGIRRRDIKKIFFSPNGVAGFVMYFSIAAAVVSLFAFGKNIFTPAYIIGLIILPLFAIFAAEPLTKLCEGEKNWLPKSMGMFIVEGFFELFETVLAYVSNTVSFLRVGAFAISHAGMMMVVFLLAETANGGSNIIAVIIGNIIVMGIEAILVCIQVMRLHFYEMFGRFYTGGGYKFTPKIIDYKSMPANI